MLQVGSCHARPALWQLRVAVAVAGSGIRRGGLSQYYGTMRSGDYLNMLSKSSRRSR